MTDSEKDTQSILGPLKSHGFRFFLIVTSLVAVIGWGLYAFYLEYVYGLGLTGDRLPVAWGLNIVDFVYFIAISMAGTIISGILRLSNATWRRPITRIAEMITICSLPIGALFPILDLGMPQRAINLLIFPRLQSPITWDTIAIVTYLVASLLYFYLPLIPDLAICRDSLKKVSKLRGWLYTRLSLGWSGGAEQASRLNKSIKIMAILVVPIAVTVHSVLSWVFSVTLRVEWHSTIFPIFFVMGAVYSGLATILIVVYAFRRFYHLERYIEVKHFLYLAYIFLAADLAMIYLTLSEYMAPSWSSETLDVQYLTSLFTGAYAPYFWFMLVGGLILPAAIISLPVTRRVGWIVVAAILANIGMWLERFLIVIPALAVPQLGLPYAVGSYIPSWEELSVTAAGFAGVALLLIIVSRLVPMISIWEVNEGDGDTVARAPIIPPALATYSGSDPEAPQSTGRRAFLRNGLVAAVGLTAGIAALSFLPSDMQNKDTANSVSQEPINQEKVQLSSIGELISQEEARTKASFFVSFPSSLPEGATLHEARISADGAMVGLLYTSESMEPLNIYTDSVDIAILQIKEDVIDSPPAFLPKGYDRITVEGHAGFTRASSKQAGQPAEPGQLQWWSNGRRCSIFANLALPKLMKIANSMEADTNA